MGMRPRDGATALPSGLALAATFNAKPAYDGGPLIGREALAKGFNVELAGWGNLARDPANPALDVRGRAAAPGQERQDYRRGRRERRIEFSRTRSLGEKQAPLSLVLSTCS